MRPVIWGDAGYRIRNTPAPRRGWWKQEKMAVVSAQGEKYLESDFDKPFHRHAVFAHELGGRHWLERLLEGSILGAQVKAGQGHTIDMHVALLWYITSTDNGQCLWQGLMGASLTLGGLGGS